MQPLTIRIDDDTVATIDDEADARDLSRADYLRRILKNRNESDEIRREYEQKLAELEREVERQQRERRQLLEQREENTELVAYASDQRELAQDEKRRRQYTIFRRAWWQIAGEPAEL